MPIDYAAADRLMELSFGKLNKSAASMEFPEPGTLSKHLNGLISQMGTTAPILSHQHGAMLATAGVEMWHRAIHSFLWSVALSNSSPLWSSVTGYYSSHFTMRAFSHSMGVFKSFTHRTAVQVVISKGHFLCETPESNLGEHAFYWKVVCEHPKFQTNKLFRQNNERDKKSDSAHRTFANYTDHLNSFHPLDIPKIDEIARKVEMISGIWLDSIPEPSKENYPDLSTVQILAFRRILAFHDFLDDRLTTNRFWRTHRRPNWCKNLMVFQAKDQDLAQPSFT